MSEVDDIRRNRFIIGLSASIILHILIFVVFQYIVSFNIEKPKEFRGAITVNLQETIPSKVSSQIAVQKKKPAPSAIKSRAAERIPSQQLIRQNIKEPEAKKESLPSISASEQAVKKHATLANKPQKPAQTYSGSLTGEVASKLPKGEVSTLSKEKAEVPVVPQGVKEKKKKEKPLPFQPGVKVEQAPLAFNVGELEAKESGNLPGKATKGEAEESAQLITGSENQIAQSKSMIEWEKGSQIRKVISMGPKPKLPGWVRKEGLKLKVTLIFKVTPDGYVTDIKVFRSSGYSDVDAAVMESVRKIVFEPVQSEKVDTAKITYIIEPK